jgi:3-oxo-5-alpha-steroid 4-dehydrogenase 3 / polyprenol reductase
MEFFLRLALLYFTGGIFVVTLLYLSPLRNSSLINHGKLLNDQNSSKWSIRKRYFWHFYLIGAIANLLLLSIRPSMPLILFEIHVIRRLVETLTIMPYSEHSRMHAVHYLLGVTFYPMVGLVLHSTTELSRLSKFLQ